MKIVLVMTLLQDKTCSATNLDKVNSSTDHVDLSQSEEHANDIINKVRMTIIS